MFWKLSFSIIFLLLLTISVSAAVDCREHNNVADELKRANAVFAGEVIAKEYRDIETGEDAGAQVLIVKFKVDRWWKGDHSKEVYLYTSITKFPDGSSRHNTEDFRFDKGKSYLVYALKFADKLMTNGCTRTKMLSEAEEELRELGEGRESIEK